MLFSSVSPRQRIVTLRAWVEKNIAACPAELPAPTMWTSRPCVFARLAARRAVGDALPGEPVEALDRQPPPRDAAGEDDRPRPQDVAAVEVHLAGRGVDPRDRPRDEDLGAEPPRLLQRAARQLVARDARREAEVVLDPRRRAGLAARRLPLDHDRAQALRCSVDGRGQPGRARADDHRVVLGRLGLGREAEQLGHPAELRPHRRSCRRRRESPGSLRPPAAGPPHCSAASGASGVSHLNVIWLRSRKRRSSAQEASQRCPTTIARGGGGSGREALQPARPADPVARQLPDLLADVRRRGRDGVVVVRLDPHHARRLGRAKPDREDRAERDRHLAEDVAGLPLADDALDPVDELDRLDAALEHGEERALARPRALRTRPAARLMSAAARASRSRSAAPRAAKTAIAAMSSAVTIDANATHPAQPPHRGIFASSAQSRRACDVFRLWR